MYEMNETSICRKIKQHMVLKHPEILYTHIANERKGMRAGFTAKSMGQLKGFPDYLIIAPSAARDGRKKGFYRMLAMEVKTAKGRVTDAQKAVGERFRYLGYASFEVVRGLHEAISTVDEYLGVKDDCTGSRQ